jgi:hypothetical protein
MILNNPFKIKIEINIAVKRSCRDTMNYPINTLLRYYPSDSSTHYTGVVTKQGVFEPNPRYKMFPSVAAWLESIPDQPTEDKLEVTVKKPVLKWNVYRRPSRPAVMWYSNKTSWPCRLYNIIMRTNKNLKKNPELCDAFNHLVEVLDGFHTTFTIRVYNGNRYQCGYVLLEEPSLCDPSEEPWRLLPVSFYRPQSTWMLYSIDEKKKFAPQVYEAYMPLYHLMEQHGVLTYVRKLNKQFEIDKLHNSIYRHKRIIQKIQYKKEKLEKQEKCFQDALDSMNQKMEALQKE